jgi:hypothetical protein
MWGYHLLPLTLSPALSVAHRSFLPWWVVMFRENYLEDLLYFYFSIQLGIDLREAINVTDSLVDDAKTHLKDITLTTDVPKDLQHRVGILCTFESASPQRVTIQLFDGNNLKVDGPEEDLRVSNKYGQNEDPTYWQNFSTR